MRQQPSGRRPRGGANSKQFISPKSQTYDSHGPDVRVRGNAMQVYEKYMSLGRDAASSGDRIGAEGFFQFAEHYYRILNDTTDPQRSAPPQERMRSTPAEPYPVNAEQPVVDQEPTAASAKGNGQAPGAASGAGEPPAGGEDAVRLDAAPAAESELPAAPVPEAEAKPESETAAPPAESKPRGRGRPRTRAKADNGSGEEKHSPANGSAGSSNCGPTGV